MVGGYKLLDLKGTNFTLNTPVKIDGIYERIESAGGKPIIMGNYSLAGVERQSKWVNFGVQGTDFHTVLGIDKDVDLLNMVVKDDDTVTFTEN